MQVFAIFAVVIVAAFIVAVVVGLAWFIAVPVAVFLLLLPLAYVIAFVTKPRAKADSTVDQRVPSTAQASYEPISDPSQPAGLDR
jgi:hypothetical protein